MFCGFTAGALFRPLYNISFIVKENHKRGRGLYFANFVSSFSSYSMTYLVIHLRR